MWWIEGSIRLKRLSFFDIKGVRVKDDDTVVAPSSGYISKKKGVGVKLYFEGSAGDHSRYMAGFRGTAFTALFSGS